MNISLEFIAKILPGEVLESAHFLVIVLQHTGHDYPRITHFLIFTLFIPMGILLLSCRRLLNDIL